MKKIYTLLILLCFLATLPCFAKEPKPKGEHPTYYKKESLEHAEWLGKMKDHMNRLQTVPLFNNESIELQLGPAQFQMTIPFR